MVGYVLCYVAKCSLIAYPYQDSTSHSSERNIVQNRGNRPSAAARSSGMAPGDDGHGSTAPEDTCQRPDASGRNGNDVMDLLDDEADAEETRAKMVGQ